ncbi:MFS transporter [Massilia niastensis]|uniref:MFS transporter n=1 Tax=Massilia niastensis TaxID=544911 RepID=UPI00035F55D1|nr:MFS transporter [Massilia niastensis]
MSAPADVVVGKIRRHIILPFVLLLIVSSLDRANLSFAALQMNAELGLSPSQYGLAVSAFFAGYLAFQFPSMYLLHRYGARRWIAGSVLMWGVFALGMMLVEGPTALYVLRCLLGLAEAGFAPGVVYLCSRWMPKRYRAAAIGMTMLAVPISVVFGGPFSGWLMSIQNPLGLSGWRWMFMAEGVLTIGFALFAWKIFVDSPAEARWLDEADKEWLRQQIARDDADTSAAGIGSGRGILRSGRVWAASGVWFALIAGAYAILYWLPQVARQFAASTPFEIGLISAVPWLGIGIGMAVNARHSDASGERFWHVLLPLLLCSVCLALATVPANGAVALVLLFVAGLGLGGAQSVFWTIPTGFLDKDAARHGITMINFCGNLGGLFGPYAIGVVRQSTGSFSVPIYAMALMLLAGALLLLWTRARAPRDGAPLSASTP